MEWRIAPVWNLGSGGPGLDLAGALSLLLVLLKRACTGRSAGDTRQRDSARGRGEARDPPARGGE